MHILVTGGAGFIGANLSRRLLDQGHSVAVIDDFSTGFRDNLTGLDVDLHEASILDPAALATSARGAEAIIHLAAIPSVPRSVAAPLPSHEANATGTLRVLEVARELGAHVTVASSSSVYGANPELPKRETMMPRPRSPYAVSKLATESYAIAWGMTYDLPTIAFRFFNVYGPLQAAGHAYAAVIPAFIDAALNDRPIPVHGDGLQTRDFTFVDSVTELLSRASTERVVSDMPVNLAFGSRRSLLDVIAEMADLMGRELPIEHLPPRVGDVRDSQADNALLLSLFPGARPVEFHVGLLKTIQWFDKLR